jgi:cobalt-zinc-cadmium efflux system membrane fusion protein
VSFVGAQVDPVSRSITARIQLVNVGDRLRLGLFGTARVVSTTDAARPEVPVVPRAALTEIDGKALVFVRIGENEFEPRNVLVGDSAPGKVAISAGLQGGEIIAIHGVFTLKSIALKATLAEDP